MTRDNDNARIVDIAKGLLISEAAQGILAQTAGLSKKKVCCCPPDQKVELARALEAAAVEVRARYAEIELP